MSSSHYVKKYCLTQALNFAVFLSMNYFKTEQMQNHPLATDWCKDMFHMKSLRSLLRAQ